MRLGSVFFVISLILIMSGCGGGRPSQSGMRVLRRNSDESTAEPQVDKNSSADSGSEPTDAKANTSKAVVSQKSKEIPKLPDGRPDPAFSTAASQMQPRAEEKEEDLSDAGRIKRTEQNLRDIGTALRRIYDAQGALPMQAMRPPNRPKAERGLLSWRVFLLPTLGYGELYRQFKLDEPWDSEHNIKLLEKIPPVFLPPGENGTKTNYLAVVGNRTAFPSRAKRVTYRDLDKKPGQVIAIVEADMAQAVPWTQPLDWKWNKELVGLGKLRGSSRFFCVWADGSVSQCDIRRLGRDTSQPFKVEKSYPIVKSDFSSKIAVKSDTGKLATDTRPSNSGESSSSSQRTTSNEPEIATDEARVTIGDIKFDPKTGESTFVSGDAKRHQLPDEEDITRITAELRQLFQEEWKNAETKSDRAEIGKKLLKKSESITEEPAALFTVLKICIDIATQNEDLDTAIQACTRQAKNFQLDEYKIKVRAVKDYLSKLDNKSNEAKVSTHIEPLVDDLFDKERYAESLEINQMLMGQLKKKESAGPRQRTNGIRKRKDQPTSRMTKLTQRHKELKAYDRAHRRAKAAIESESGSTESKNLAVGVYLSFYLNDWEEGLALLGKSGESKLANIARFDNRTPSKVLDQYDLAESWWDYSDSTADEIVKHSARERASFWYKRCVESLPAGLKKLKAKQRIEREGGSTKSEF